MTTFYMCRHGQTENNKNRRLSGWIDTPLTDEGVQHAHAAAQKLQGVTIDKIISSDLGRAFVTAYIIARDIHYADELGLAKELREVNYGSLANQLYDAYPDIPPEENTHYIAPGGESLAQMQQRVLAYIRQLSADNPDKTILLAGHDGTINAVRSSFTGQAMGIVDRIHNAHDFVGTFTYDDGHILSFREVN